MNENDAHAIITLTMGKCADIIERAGEVRAANLLRKLAFTVKVQLGAPQTDASGVRRPLHWTIGPLDSTKEPPK